MNTQKQQAFDVFLYGIKIDTVFYLEGFTVEEVQKSLIDHDGYNSDIKVRLGK